METTMPIGRQVTGRFSFLALYPLDTQVIFQRFPRRESPRTPRPYLETPVSLRNALNGVPLDITPEPKEIGSHPLTFEVVPLRNIFDDSPNATWSMLQAELPDQLKARFRDLFTKEGLPSGVTLETVNARLLLFDGGIAILAVEPSYLLAGAGDYADSVHRFPEIVKATAEKSVRYEDQDVMFFCESLLTVFAARLRRVVTGGSSPEALQVSPSFRPFYPRLRPVSVPEIYPTIITKIWCTGTIRPSGYAVKASDLTRVMYLDESEVTNALPNFEDDFIAVGYDSVWWLLAAHPEERTPRFRHRVELTLEYSLAISHVIYVLHAEIDRELGALRPLLLSRDRLVQTDELVFSIQSRRGEVEDLLKEISLESFSTWVSDIYLFKTILDRWLVNVSIEALRRKIDAVNVLIRELHERRTEGEQRKLTTLGTIFAAASVSALFVGGITLLFTETPRESQNPTMAWWLFGLKVFVLILLGALPPTLVWFIPLWNPRIRKALDRIRSPAE